MHRPRLVLPHRRGVILVVVLLLLTLFTTLALSFMLYANSAAQAARFSREAEQPRHHDVDPELLLSYFLDKLIYDAPDDETGVYCALRGHSLARSLYGGNGGSVPSHSVPTANVTPFNGMGRLSAPSPFGTTIPGTPVDDVNLINYTFYPGDPQLPVGQRFLRDPERVGWRTANPRAQRGPFTGGLNAPYTYPDLNSVYIAAVRADGTVLLPSFHRPWTSAVPGLPATVGEFYDPQTGQLNPLWSSAPPTLPPWYKYTTLRPLPALNPGFPPPEDGGGDVKNLSGGPGTFRRQRNGVDEHWSNDSFWMDLGFPVMTAPSGRKYKPLFAALVVDLDGRVNVNVHGNTHAAGGAHGSHQGWGPWEVNPARILTGANGLEARQLLRGRAVPPHVGRYGGAPWAGQLGVPGSLGEALPPGPTPHFYAPVDFAGLGVYGNRALAERLNHAQLYNPFRPGGDDRRFALSNMEALLRYGETGSHTLTADLFRLCPTSFQDARARRLITTYSRDLDRPGTSPWPHDPLNAPYEVQGVAEPDRPGQPQGSPIGSPNPLARLSTPAGVRPPDQGDFHGLDWRSLSASLGRIDLSRTLPPYPHMGSGSRPPFGPPLTVRGGQVAFDIAFSVDAPTGPIWRQFLAAQEARQRLAEDLYRRLLAVTGVVPILPDQNPQAPLPELLRTRRWLAQLAANVVDYLDDDDISTSFCFYTAEDYRHLLLRPAAPPDPGRVDPRRLTDSPNGEVQWPLYWVFGTELPKVVLSEVMAQSQRSEPFQAYVDQVRVFVELQNTFPRTVPAGAALPDTFPVPLRINAGSTVYSPYRLHVGVRTPVEGQLLAGGILPGPDDANVLGNLDLAALRTVTTDLDFVRPLGTIAGEPQVAWPGAVSSIPYSGLASPYVPTQGPGYLLLGPPEIPPTPDPPPDPAPPPNPFGPHDPFVALRGSAVSQSTPVLRALGLQYDRFFPIHGLNDPPDERTQGLVVTLRRLANPYLPFDGRRNGVTGFDPNLTYNPFLTVDFVEGVPLQAVENVARLISVGKQLPYASHRNTLAPQQTGPTPTLLCTFGRDNLPLSPAREEPIHLDRPLVSPLELLHVSGHQPYQLTQRFLAPDVTGRLVKHGHRAPWLDEELVPGSPHRRLSRFLEFVTAGARPTGVAVGGRIPGKVNVNTIWDPETLLALFDPQPVNAFRDLDIANLFLTRFYDTRPSAPFDPLRRTVGIAPGKNDRPFRSMGDGTYPMGDSQVPNGGGVADSPLRLQPPFAGGLPILESQMLTKALNHLTTRSNVFAIWVTVGFFEVTDLTSRPVKLGAELGRAENRHVRHRMFAIVDRTNLSIATGVASLTKDIPHIPGVPTRFTVSVSALEGTTPLSMTGPPISWRIRPGTLLLVDVGDRQETVEVLAVDTANGPPTISAVFTKPHAAGTPLSLAETAGASPVFLEALAVARPDPLPGPPYLPPLPYAIDVTIGIDPMRSGKGLLVGEYDGTPWRIEPGTPLLLDVGPNQEMVTVAPVPFLVNAAGQGTFRLLVTRPHADGFVISNTLTGNPGPQPRFDPRDPRFASVVRYLSVVD